MDPLDLDWLANATNTHGDISLVDNYFLAIDFLGVSNIQLSGQLMALKTQNGHILRNLNREYTYFAEAIDATSRSTALTVQFGDGRRNSLVVVRIHCFYSATTGSGQGLGRDLSNEKD